MLLSLWDTVQDNWEGWAVLSGLIFGSYFAIVWIAATYWAYKDISARTREPVTQMLMVLLVLVFFLPGLLLYLIIRPKLTLSERYDRQLEAEALLRELQEDPACPFCRRKIGADFVMCPYCRTALGAPCESCLKVLSFSWVLCPYCGTERRQETPEAAPAPPAATTPAEPKVARPRRPAATARYTPPAPQPATAEQPSAQPSSPEAAAVDPGA